MTHVARHDVKTRVHSLLPIAWAEAGQRVIWTWNEPTQLPATDTFGFFSSIRGHVEVAAIRRGGPPLDDMWTLDVILGCWVPGNSDTSDGESSVVDAASTVLTVINTNPFLDDGSGPVACITSASVGEFDGPTPWRGADGAGAATRLELRFTTRLQEEH